MWELKKLTVSSTLTCFSCNPRFIYEISFVCLKVSEGENHVTLNLMGEGESLTGH